MSCPNLETMDVSAKDLKWHTGVSSISLSNREVGRQRCTSPVSKQKQKL